MSAHVHFSKPITVFDELMKRMFFERVTSKDTHRAGEYTDGSTFVEHIFNIPNQKELSLTHQIVRTQAGFISNLFLGGDLSIDCWANKEGQQNFFDIVLKDGYLNLFNSTQDKISLAPFFSRQSELRSRLIGILEQQDVVPAIPMSQHIWKAIKDTGGITNLRDIWEELFEEDIKIQMLKMDPYCFDVEGFERFESIS